MGVPRLAAICAAAAILGCGGQGTQSIAFSPSNLAFDELPTAKAEISLTPDSCGARAVFDTDAVQLFCYGPDRRLTPFGIPKVLSQSDGSEIALVTVQSLRLGNGTQLDVVGARPLALLSMHGMTIDGTIAARDRNAPFAGAGGGAGEGPQGHSNGGGPGGGRAAAAAGAGAGGGSHCGAGGSGSDQLEPAAAGGAGGPTYGTPELIPLTAGSAGGRTAETGHAGAGGGALHLIAGTRLTIGPTGRINMGGGGGGAGGNGAGSGGAILLEAPHIIVDGALAANGGGGGSSTQDGADGRSDGLPAAGGGGDANAHGGAGSSDLGVQGESVEPSSAAAGGGGGAGRIRINTWAQTAPTLNGSLSPAFGTGCTTIGAIAPVP